MKIKIRDARCAFFHAITPRFKNDAGEDTYNLHTILPPGHPGIQQVEEAMAAAAKEKWGEKGPATLAQLKAGGRVCLRDGATMAEYEGFEGNLFVSASNTSRPSVRDYDGVTEIQAMDGRVYSGARVHVILDIWAQDNAKGGKRINAKLLGVQRYRDADAFAPGAAATDGDFEPEEPEDLSVNGLT